MEALRQKYDKVVFVTDNAKSHDSKLIKDYLKLAGGDVVLIYLPAYTPQLNPIEIQWRIIKARLAGRYFAAEDEMEDSIIRLIESGEVQPVQVTGLPMGLMGERAPPCQGAETGSSIPIRTAIRRRKRETAPVLSETSVKSYPIDSSLQSYTPQDVARQSSGLAST